MGCILGRMEDYVRREFLIIHPREIGRTLELPIPSNERKMTDKIALCPLTVLVIIFVVLYILAEKESATISSGTDSCGNICGVVNPKIDGVECSGADYSKKKRWRRLENGTEICTDLCLDTEDIWDCYNELPDKSTLNYFKRSFEMVLDSWSQFLILLVATLILAFVSIVLFHCHPRASVWGFLIFGELIFIILSVLSILYIGIQSLVAFMLICMSIIILIIIVCWREQIRLIITLFNETTKVIAAIPSMFVIPVTAAVAQISIIALFTIGTTYMLIGWQQATVVHVTGYIFPVTLFMASVMEVFGLKLVAGCQRMILSGCTAQWFFKRNELRSPMGISLLNTIYHLGSIIFGTLLLISFFLLRAIVEGLISNKTVKESCRCMLEIVEQILVFISNMAYVEIAIYGQPFCKSGARATYMLLKNLSGILSVGIVGRFIIGIVELLILMIISAVAYVLFTAGDFLEVMFFLCANLIFNIILVFTIFSLFKTVVDALFICYCEDMTINDGSAAKPYCMSVDLQEFIEKANELYREEPEEAEAPAPQ